MGISERVDLDADLRKSRLGWGSHACLYIMRNMFPVHTAYLQPELHTV